MDFLDWLTLISYVALNADVLFQIRRIYQTKSSKDLSLFGMAIRYIAIIIILVKFVNLSDITLVIGQSLITITFTVYFGLAIAYFYYHKPKT